MFIDCILVLGTPSWPNMDITLTGHNFDLDNITIIDKCPQWNRRLFLEAWHSTENKNAINEHIEFPRIYYNLKNFN